MDKGTTDNYIFQEQIATRQSFGFQEKFKKLNKLFKDAEMVSSIMIIQDDISVIIDPGEVEQATKMIESVGLECLT